MIPRWIVPVLCVVLGAVGGFGYAQLIAPKYETTATVVVNATTPTGDRRDAAIALTLSRLSNQTEAVAAAATAVKLTPEQVTKSVRGAVTPDNPVIAITATASTAAQAAEIANAVADGLVKFSTEKMRTLGVTVAVFNVASAPVEPSSPNVVLDLAVGVGAGVLLGALYLLATGGRRGSVAPATPAPPAAASRPFPGAVPPPPTARLPAGPVPLPGSVRPAQGYPQQGRPPGPPPRSGPPPNNRPPGPPPGGPRAPVPPPRQGGRPG